jgi:hypothetical protein
VLTDDVLELFDNKGEWLGLFFGVAEVLVLAHAPDEHEGLLEMYSLQTSLLTRTGRPRSFLWTLGPDRRITSKKLLHLDRTKLFSVKII